MAIDAVSGLTAMNNTAKQAERSADMNKNAVEANSTVSQSVQFDASTTKGAQGAENGEGKNSESQEEHLKSALSVANQKIRMTNTRCEFEYHENTKRVSITVIDKDTDEIIREIPPEESLEMVEKLWELAGLILDERC